MAGSWLTVEEDRKESGIQIEGMTSEDRLLEGESGEEEDAENGEGEAGEGEPEKKKLRKRERVAKMFARDGKATNLAEG